MPEWWEAPVSCTVEPNDRPGHPYPWVGIAHFPGHPVEGGAVSGAPMRVYGHSRDEMWEILQRHVDGWRRTQENRPTTLMRETREL